ncbi:MAG: enoyl-CoA hydratase, partial [Hyphomicrobiales bacterium]
RSSPEAMRAIKHLVYGAQFTDLAQAVRDANVEMARSLAADDFKEGLAAFAEKRDPNYRGLSA